MFIKQHRGQFVTPDNTVALMNTVGPTRAARMLGVSTTLLYTARKKSEVSAVVEKAASFALREPILQEPPKARRPAPAARPEPEPVTEPEETLVCLVEMPKSKMDLLEKFARQMHAPILVS